MKLYGFPPSPNTRKVLAAAAHAGVPVELVLVDLTKGQQRTPEFLARNPNGKTPVLEDGDFVLWESNAIMQYVAARKPNGLWPDDARARADITRWQCWQLAQLNEGTRILIFENLIKQVMGMGEPDPQQTRLGEEFFHRDAAVLDAHLAKHPYLAGDKLSLADFSVASYLALAEPAKMPAGSYKNLAAWYARIDALPAWQQTQPKM